MLERDSFTVFVNPREGDMEAPPSEHTATITHQDRLRGEQAHLAGGGRENAYLGATTAWCWASLMRQGDYSGPYERFRDIDCAGIEKAEPVVVDPTQLVTTGDSA